MKLLFSKILLLIPDVFIESLSIIDSSIALTSEAVEIEGVSFETYECDIFEILLVVLKNKIIIL